MKGIIAVIIGILLLSFEPEYQFGDEIQVNIIYFDYDMIVLNSERYKLSQLDWGIKEVKHVMVNGIERKVLCVSVYEYEANEITIEISVE